ncbi:hypothetical protein I3F58_09400 [Streptomyces sp. MUM 203J]|uniref:hypothetical protein n=1 Tax=Streptomyces sp. MUM 203J TaxID=2791990 RepID=UPI001F04A150|nr:hypothetical protein [Streptomyces sp. MUM 203J]MCH0539774.1 hypothetical protein [Streptomyces sp. MUM 203J]
MGSAPEGAAAEHRRDGHRRDRPEGAVSAAILAAGLGAAALGVLTTLAEASTSVKDWLAWSEPVGSLSGKTLLALAVWLVAWAVLHVALRKKAVETVWALVVCLVLIGVGVLGTFPLFFRLFEP